MPQFEYRHRVSRILQRGQYAAGGWGPGATYCRAKDCWAACGAMLAALPGGSTPADSHAIDEVRLGFLKYAQYNQAWGEQGIVPTDQGLSTSSVHTFSNFLARNDVFPIPSAYASGVPLARELARAAQRGPVLLLNQVLSPTGQPGSRHVTILHRVVYFSEVEFEMSEEDAVDMLLYWNDPWPTFLPSVVQPAPGFIGTPYIPIVQTAHDPPPQWPYRGEPASGGYSGSLPYYNSKFRILGWIESLRIRHAWATPNATSTVRTGH